MPFRQRQPSSADVEPDSASSDCEEEDELSVVTDQSIIGADEHQRLKHTIVGLIDTYRKDKIAHITWDWNAVTGTTFKVWKAKQADEEK